MSEAYTGGCACGAIQCEDARLLPHVRVAGLFDLFGDARAFQARGVDKPVRLGFACSVSIATRIVNEVKGVDRRMPA
jgi:hypothetical protein